MYARVTKVMAQFVLKIGKLSHIIETAPIDLYHMAAILSPRRTKSFVFTRLALHWMRG